MATIEICNLWVQYGKFTAVNDLSFTIPSGEVFGFIGPNGAGKTSTIKVLATLLKPTRGTVRVGGIDVVEDPYKVRRMIGYMPDYFGVYDDLVVNEYLHFFAAAYGLDSATRHSVVGDVLDLTDLADKRDASVDKLSRGMKQRLGLARVLLHDPDFLLLDEPASGLDPRARIEIRELLKELRNMGKTILVSSHILHELSEFCTHIGILEAGRMVAQGSLIDIYQQLEINRTVHVQFADPDPTLAQRIGAIAGVNQVDQHVNRFSISIREDEISVTDLHHQIHALGANLYMFQPEAMDMETVFMKLTEGRTA